MRKTILMAGLSVNFQSEDPAINLVCTEKHKSFLTNQTPEINIAVRLGKPPNGPSADPEFQSRDWAFFRSGDFFTFRTQKYGSPDATAYYSIVLPADKKCGELYLENISSTIDSSIPVYVPPLFIDSVLGVHLVSLHNGLMFHACGLETSRGNGLLFCGPSGTGKSTTGKLWQNDRQAFVLGDECIAILKKGGVFWLHSTAWHGNGQPSIPNKTIANNLFILHHSSTNQSRLLKPAEAVAKLLPLVFLPYWHREQMNASLMFLEDLCTSIPCYQLGFTPDQRAVDYVQCLISS